VQLPGFKTRPDSGWHQPLFDAFSFRKASKMPLLGLYGRVAMAYVHGFGLKAIAPFRYWDGFEHPAARDTSGSFFLT